MERMIKATVNTWRGLRFAAMSEAAFREELIVLALAIPAAALISPDLRGRALLIGAVLFVMIVELLNTAIEKLCDRVTTSFDVQIGNVKDMGSAAVGLSILLALAIWAPMTLEAAHIL